MTNEAYDLHRVHNTILQKKKTMSINHTVIVSINYTLPTRVFREQIIQFIKRINTTSKVPETQTWH